MANAWIEHVKRWRAEYGQGMKYKDVLIEARKTYVPVAGSTTTRAPKAKAKGTRVKSLPREDISRDFNAMSLGR